MKCPKCNEELHCPCENCAKWNKNKTKWIWVMGEVIECPKCGFAEHCDNWEEDHE